MIKQHQPIPDQKGKMTVMILVLVLILVVAAVTVGRQFFAGTTTQGGSAGKVSITVDGDLVIPISEVTETAAFYPVEANGTSLEVLAVKAPDGTIRTAFNTCQVCFDSGRGYYEQQGDVLVCQNCGNRYPMSEVEVTRGGCNPVPIFPEEKTVDETSITISQEFLTEASIIFSNWKLY